MNINPVNNLHKSQTELDKQSVKNKGLEHNKKLNIDFSCAFYDKCALPKDKALCNQFPDFMICTDYISRRNKVLDDR